MHNIKINKLIHSRYFSYIADVTIFIGITLLLHHTWWYFVSYIHAFSLFISSAGFLAKAVFEVASWIDIHILGMNITHGPDNLMVFQNKHAFYVNTDCSGLKQMFQLFVLLLVMPGAWKHKLWFIPAALLSLFFINVIRIIGLSYTMQYIPQYWDFFHLWVMRSLFYVWIFIVWVMWVEYFRKRRINEQKLELAE